MIRTDKRLRLCAALIGLNLCVIWGNSLLPGEISGAISDWVKGVLACFLPAGEDDSGGGLLIRKLGHFSEFACLGALLAWLFSMVEKPRIFALGLGCLAGAVDETIQRFVPDRGPSILDVGIDTLGAAFGISLLLLTHYIRKNSFNRRR